MDEKDRKIAALESQILTLASRINQFNKLFAATTLAAADSNLRPEIGEKLGKVIRGESSVKHWIIKTGQPLEPILVDE